MLIIKSSVCILLNLTTLDTNLLGYMYILITKVYCMMWAVQYISIINLVSACVQLLIKEWYIQHIFLESN